MHKHVVFLHGFLENKHMWNSVLGRVSKSKLTLHFPEIPGHGQRPLNNIPPSIDAFADDILSQLDIPESEKFILIGHSMGGYIGANIGARYAHRLEALCMFQSKVTPDSEEKKAARLRAIEAARQDQALYVRTMINGLYAETERERLNDTIEEQIAYAKSLSFEAIAAALTAMRERDNKMYEMKNRPFSLFYYLGEKDPSIPLSEVLEEIQMLPGAAYHIEQGIGHMGHFEAPQHAGDFIQRMLRSIVV